MKIWIVIAFRLPPDMLGIFGCGSSRKKANRFASKFGLRAMVANGGASLEAWV
jgi:hypothetical protein